MFKVIIILIVFSFSFQTEGQRSYKNQIKISLLRIVDPFNPGIEINYERFHSDKFASELCLAYMHNIVKSDNFEGFRFGFEEKKYLKSRIKNVSSNVSTQIVYNNSAFMNVKNKGYDALTNTYINDPFKVVKKTAALNLQVGLEFILKRFVIEESFGIGIKYRELKHFDRKYPYIRAKFWDQYAESSEWVINLPATIKIGYIF